jgi:hypothetical protein
MRDTLSPLRRKTGSRHSGFGTNDNEGGI